MSKQDKEEFNSWHLDKKVTVGLLFSVSTALIVSISSTIILIQKYSSLLESLDTEPPLPEQIRQLQWENVQRESLDHRMVDLMKELKELSSIHEKGIAINGEKIKSVDKRVERVEDKVK